MRRTSRACRLNHTHSDKAGTYRRKDQFGESPAEGTSAHADIATSVPDPH
ncbi:MAG: hypothetical protein ACRDNS_00910 [Trebonia sp.]